MTSTRLVRCFSHEPPQPSGPFALATLTAAAFAVPLTAGPTAGAEAAAAPIEEYVALGDSWSADVVLADTNGLPDSTYAPVDCA